MAALKQFLERIRRRGVRRSETVRTSSMGRERVFEAYDLGPDTYVFEKGVLAHLAESPSVLIVEKRRLDRPTRGRVMTISTGNHAVAAFPLLDGRFWKISKLPAEKRSATLLKDVVCANVVKDTLEISQREVATADLVAADAWLLETVGFAMNNVVLAERNETTLDHYRRLGQEWRVKPLAWTDREVRVALAASRKRIASAISYYHSATGVHFLTYPDFCRFVGLAESDPEAFVKGLRELAGVYEGNACSFVRMPKHRGHHEIEFFGIRRNGPENALVPELESLLDDIVCGRTGQLGVIQKAEEIAARFKSLLTNPELADEQSVLFAQTLYMCITGEIYAIVGEGSTPAFDDRRTALPGATFVDGHPVLHPGADDRTEVLLSNLRAMTSKDEVVEYANVYELRAGDAQGPLGRGSTREIVYKTNVRPLENSLVEKRMSRSSAGYGPYVLARIGALRGLGVALSDFYLMLKRRDGLGRRPLDYYIRRRCEGEPMETIPANYFRRTGGGTEDTEVVRALAALMGDAAAQNMAMLKFDARTHSPLFGVGKEIYEFEYDIVRERALPKRVSICSVRGSFGWPSLEQTEENGNALADFYLGHFAAALRAYHANHPSVPLANLAERFMDGFEFRAHTMAWHLSVMRDRFEAFAPNVLPRYAFARKWKFAMWSLDRTGRRLRELRQLFMEKMK